MQIQKAVLLSYLEQFPESFILEDFLALLLPHQTDISFEKGSYSSQDKLSDFSGIWENDHRNAQDLRKQAWRIK